MSLSNGLGKKLNEPHWQLALDYLYPDENVSISKQLKTMYVMKKLGWNKDNMESISNTDLTAIHKAIKKEDMNLKNSPLFEIS